MGRSQETVAKKEKEKRKARKKQDKREKKLERKTSNNKGKSLEDMMVYLDEDGNFTDTPPDPRKKKEIDVSEIRLGAEPVEPEDTEIIRNGTITYFNDSKGYGFIRDHKSQESIFVHVNQAEEPIQEGDKVVFEIERGPRGFSAVRVKKK